MLPDLKSPKVVISKDVVFDEMAMLHPKKQSIVSNSVPKQVDFKVEEVSTSYNCSVSGPVETSTPVEEEIVEEVQEHSIAKDRLRRKIKKPFSLADYVNFACVAA